MPYALPINPYQHLPPASFAAVAAPSVQNSMQNNMAFPQTAALPAQAPPEMLAAYQQKMMAIMADPQKKALFTQLLQASQTGQIPPAQLAEQLDKLVSQGDSRPKGMLPAFLMASLVGVGLGQVVRSSLSQFERSDVKSSWLEQGLHIVDHIPGVGLLNKGLDTMIKQRQAASKNGVPSKLSRLLKLDGYYETDAIKREMVQRHLGINGVYQTEMSQMENNLKHLIAPEKLTEVLKRLRATSRHSELMQILKPEAIYFVPASMRDYVRKYTSTTNGHSATLQELDQIISKNEFIKTLGETNAGRELLQSATNPLGKLIRESSPQAFAKVYEKSILANTEYTGFLQKAWAKPLPKTYDSLRSSLGLKPYWNHIYDNLKGLLYEGDKAVSAFFDPKSTLALVDEKIARHHIVKHLDQLTPWRIFMEQIKGFIKRFQNFEQWHMPIIESSKAFIDQMKLKNIKPVGRLTGLLWFNFSRMFEGNHYQRWRLVNVLNKQSSGYLNRLFIAATIFGASVLLSQTGRPETRRSRFFDSIATGLGGFYGWELGKNIVPQLEPVGNNTLAHILSKRVLRWPATVTVGGFINYFFLPFFVTSWLFGTLAQKPVHLIFGNPDKLERTLNKKDADKLSSQLKLPNAPASPQLSMTQPAYFQQAQQPLYANYSSPNPYYSPYAYMNNNYYPSPFVNPYSAWNNNYSNYYPSGQYAQPIAENPALSTLPQEKTKQDSSVKSKIEPVSIAKASQKIPKVTYTLDTKGSFERLARNPLEDSAHQEEERMIRRLKSIGF